ncbi:hypothetical protein [Jatrophihabitans endophyticus]|uniref:hypothetical protein n=1 Tax=Jatrophihabitans endophyticus TaxID=1206085 RepID=UPI0019EB4267|nr:hypothetical protein [Jatrophihabitans endophyticus]MBE7187240.1 hypothetical protein [Jatrophihabitans endophyticus]
MPAIEPSGDGPAVVAHIGEPKTGTTHFQEIVWRNRPALAAAGLNMAGHSVADQFRAMQDLRGLPPEADDPGGSWVGEWDVLAAQARRARRIALISQESIAAADADRVGHAVRSLGPDVHVVLTVRDFASLLPAEWQETVKHRRTRGWTDWLATVRATEPAAGTRPAWGFWRVHDTPEVLRIWSRFVPADRLHVVTMPRRGSDPDVLWHRLAGLLGVDGVDVDTGVRANSSLGLSETEFLRRLNPALEGRVPNWFYAREVKHVLAHGVLAARPSPSRPTLPADVADWASARSEAVIEYLRSSGVDVVGDLDELVPAPERPAADPDREAGIATVDDQLDAAVQSLAALVERSHRRAVRERAAGSDRTATGLAMDVVRRSPRLTRAVRRLGTRPGGAWTRVAAWRAHEASVARQGARRDTRTH